MIFSFIFFPLLVNKGRRALVTLVTHWVTDLSEGRREPLWATSEGHDPHQVADEGWRPMPGGQRMLFGHCRGSGNPR